MNGRMWPSADFENDHFWVATQLGGLESREQWAKLGSKTRNCIRIFRPSIESWSPSGTGLTIDPVQLG